MKARIRPEKEVFLLYHLGEDTEKGKQLRKVLLPLGIELVDVSDQMLLETVAFCAHMDGAASTGNVYAGEPLPYELMVMKGVTRARLNQVLDLLSKAGVERVERKAVVTETNRSWTFLKLYQEVCREHDMMTGQTPTN